MRNTFVDLHGIRAFGSNFGFVISESPISSDILPFSVLLGSRNKSDLVVSLPLEGEARCHDQPLPEVRRPEVERVKLTPLDWEAGLINSRTSTWRSVAASFDLRPVPLASQSRFPARVISFLDYEILFLGRVDRVPCFLWMIRFVSYIRLLFSFGRSEEHEGILTLAVTSPE